LSESTLDYTHAGRFVTNPAAMKITSETHVVIMRRLLSTMALRKHILTAGSDLSAIDENVPMVTLAAL